MVGIGATGPCNSFLRRQRTQRLYDVHRNYSSSWPPTPPGHPKTNPWHLLTARFFNTRIRQSKHGTCCQNTPSVLPRAALRSNRFLHLRSLLPRKPSYVCTQDGECRMTRESSYPCTLRVLSTASPERKPNFSLYVSVHCIFSFPTSFRFFSRLSLLLVS